MGYYTPTPVYTYRETHRRPPTDLNLEVPETFPELKHFLTKTTTPREWMALAEDPRTPPEVLAYMAKEKGTPFNEVRTLIALNHRTPLETLEELALDSFWLTQKQVARNPKATETILLKVLENARSSHVKQAVALVENLPESVIKLLIAAPEEEVRWALADNHSVSLSKTQLRSLWNHKRSFQVTEAIAKRPDNAPEFLEEIYRKFPRCAATLATHLRATPEFLATLGKEGNWSTRMAVASNPNTPDSVLEQLLEDPGLYQAVNHEARRRGNIYLTALSSSLMESDHAPF